MQDLQITLARGDWEFIALALYLHAVQSKDDVYRLQLADYSATITNATLPQRLPIAHDGFLPQRSLQAPCDCVECLNPGKTQSAFRGGL